MATQMVSLSQPYGNRSAALCTLARQKAIKASNERIVTGTGKADEGASNRRFSV
jgi:hypothetical protein